MKMIYLIKFWWLTRGMTHEEKFKFLQQDLRDSYEDLKVEFSNEPQTREMIDAFDSIEKVLQI